MNNGGIVILGNGGAAAHAARAARAAGYRRQIRMVSDVDAPPFNPMLSPYYLKGEIPWDRCFPFGRDFYREHDIICHFNAAVEYLDTANQRVLLSEGQELPYDRCLIATGASPIVPPVPGLKDSPHTFTLRTAASTMSLKRALPFARRAVVLGASLVGLKVAEILARNGVHVVLLDVVDQILPNGAHPSTAALLRAHFEEHGVDVRLGCAMEGMESTGSAVVCHFPDSIVEQADLVVVCTGVRPNLGFLDPDRVEIDRAVVVDDRMQTSVPNLYAAGDVSQGIDLLSGKTEWAGTWGNACRQGIVAGQNMASRDVAFPGFIQQNISPFFGWTYAQLGDVGKKDGRVRHVSFGDPREGGHLLLAFERGVLVGANLINSTHLAGRLQRAILKTWEWGRHLEQADGGRAERGVERILDELVDDNAGYRTFLVDRKARPC